MKAQSVIDVMLGEAAYGTRAQRWADMVAIASVIENRARQLGVTPEDVVATSQEFHAFGKALPDEVEKYRSLAQQALDYVKQNGPVHNAEFYATPDDVDFLPDGLTEVMRTTGHVFKDDPQRRSIMTAKGYKTPGRTVSLPSSPPTPTRSPGGLGLSPSIAGMGGLGAQASGTAQFAEAVNPARWGARPAGPASGLFGATTGIDPNKPFDFAGMDMGRMLSKNVAISPSVAAQAAGLKTSPQNWDVGPTSPFDFSKIDMGRMLSNTVTPRGTGWTPAPSTPEQRAAHTAAAAAKNATLDSPFEAMRVGLDNSAFAAIQGNELQIGKPAPPETQIAAAPSTPTVSGRANWGVGPGLGMVSNIEFSPTTDETITAYGPDESFSDETVSAPEETPSQSRLERLANSPLGRAAVGGLLGGPIGAAIGLGSGLFDGDMDLGGLGRGFGPAGLPSGAERRNAGFAGYGMHAMERGMYGPRGTLGMSRSQPGTYSVSRGPGLGYDLTNKYGARTTYSADGHIMGNSNLAGRLGGLFGGLFGGSDKKSDKPSKAERDKYSGKAGLY